MISESRNPEPEPANATEQNTSAEPSREKQRPARVIRYGAMAWVGEFSQKPGARFGCGSKVIVQTERGIELGEPIGVPCGDCGGDLFVPRAQLLTYVKNSGQDFCRSRAGRVLRGATQQDLNEQAHLNAHIQEDIEGCAELADELKLDIKIVTAEHLLGGERIVFYFRSPQRVDFRALVKELAKRYRTRIEMRQVGARDEARLVADYEMCGRECCCRNFLKELRHVNMKMAKLQKSTLDPSKVSGRCGRLRCCLRYEHLGYEELAARLPRPGVRVETEFGTGTVFDRQVLTQLVLVRLDENEGQVAIPFEEIRAFNLPPLAKPPAAEPRAAAGGAGFAAERDERRRGPRRRADRGTGPAPREAPASDRPVDELTDAAPVVPEPPVEPQKPAADNDVTPRETAAPGAAAADEETTSRRRRRRGRRRRGRGPGAPPAGDEGPPE